MVLLNKKNVIPHLGFNSKVLETNLCYLNNSAINHMTRSRLQFIEFDESVKVQVKFGGESILQIERNGSIHFLCKNGEQRWLQEVYYIPDLCSNIISLG